MGSESIIYGIIEGATWRSDDFRRLHRLNRQILDQALPMTDEWPFLTRGMFSIPGEECHEGTYRTQVIHFGASIKDAEEEWDNWVVKFEVLLSRLYWTSALVHLHSEVGGSRRYEWVIDPDQIDRFLCDPPLPIAKWTRKGGPSTAA